MSSQWDSACPAGPRSHPLGPGSDKTPGVRPLGWGVGERGGNPTRLPLAAAHQPQHIQNPLEEGVCLPACASWRGGWRLQKADSLEEKEDLSAVP